MSAYYVSPSGSDSNPGSQSAPFATIQRGVDIAQPGDTIVVSGLFAFNGAQDAMGVNINKAGTQAAPITLLSQGAVLDGRLLCHSWLNLQGAAAWWIIDGLEILNDRWCGILSNSDGGKNIIVRGCQIHNIGNRVESATIGIDGIYTDGGAQNFRVEGCSIYSVGRTNDAGNSYDHGIYSHGNLQIVGNSFADARTGWHIQTADGFSGVIQGNTFNGPNQYPNRGGQVMLWGSDGAIDISGNQFVNPGGPALIYFQFSSPQVTMGGNTVSGSGSVGGPPGAVNMDAPLVSVAIPAPTITPVVQQPVPAPIIQPAPIVIQPQSAPVAFLGPPAQAPSPLPVASLSQPPSWPMLVAGAALVLWLLSDWELYT